MKGQPKDGVFHVVFAAEVQAFFPWLPRTDCPFGCLLNKYCMPLFAQEYAQHSGEKQSWRGYYYDLWGEKKIVSTQVWRVNCDSDFSHVYEFYKFIMNR